MKAPDPEQRKPKLNPFIGKDIEFVSPSLTPDTCNINAEPLPINDL
jgi:hypothetical protein